MQKSASVCKATRKDGSVCKAPAQAGKDLCFFHDPDRAEANAVAKRRGGEAGKLAVLSPDQVKPWRGRDGEVEVLQNVTTAELVSLLADTIDDVRTGRVDPKVSNAVGYLVGIMTRVLQYDALEERLAAIEEAVIGNR